MVTNFLFLLQEHLSGQICLGAIKTLAVKMEELLLSHRNLKISIKGLSGFEFDLNQCKSKYNGPYALLLFYITHTNSRGTAA